MEDRCRRLLWTCYAHSRMCVRLQLAFPSMRISETWLISTSSIVPKRFSTQGNNQWIRVMAQVKFPPHASNATSIWRAKEKFSWRDPALFHVCTQHPSIYEASKWCVVQHLRWLRWAQTKEFGNQVIIKRKDLDPKEFSALVGSKCLGACEIMKWH